MLNGIELHGHRYIEFHKELCLRLIQNIIDNRKLVLVASDCFIEQVVISDFSDETNLL